MAVNTGESSIPTKDTISTIKPKVPAVLFKRSFNASFSCVSFVLLITGTKACEKAPSANNLLKKFGILFAKKYTSAERDAPNREAIAISLSIPKIRERKVAKAVIAPDFSSPDFFLLSTFRSLNRFYKSTVLVRGC